jgi:hypothetical protein
VSHSFLRAYMPTCATPPTFEKSNSVMGCSITLLGGGTHRQQ